jgi:DNA-binding NarL/FixJ family response regulator
VLSYTAGAHQPRRPALLTLPILFAGICGVNLGTHATTSDYLFPSAVALISWLAGRAIRARTLLTEALRAGASGFLLKDVPPEQLAAGIRIVAQGEALLAPSITKRLIQKFARATPATPEPPKGLDELTARELEVFKLVARGLSNAEIAAELIVSETTVKTHVARVLMKLDLRDRVQAVVLAYEHGIAVPGQAG